MPRILQATWDAIVSCTPAHNIAERTVIGKTLPKRRWMIQNQADVEKSETWVIIHSLRRYDNR